MPVSPTWWSTTSGHSRLHRTGVAKDFSHTSSTSTSWAPWWSNMPLCGYSMLNTEINDLGNFIITRYSCLQWSWCSPIGRLVNRHWNCSWLNIWKQSQTCPDQVKGTGSHPHLRSHLFRWFLGCHKIFTLPNNLQYWHAHIYVLLHGNSMVRKRL